jgi:hypothetical protein
VLAATLLRPATTPASLTTATAPGEPAAADTKA